jgi:hypothetical protein
MTVDASIRNPPRSTAGSENYVRNVWLIATASGRKMSRGAQAASVGRSRLKLPSDWQANVTIVKAMATPKQMLNEKNTLRLRRENISGRPSINRVPSITGCSNRE